MKIIITHVYYISSTYVNENYTCTFSNQNPSNPCEQRDHSYKQKVDVWTPMFRSSKNFEPKNNVQSLKVLTLFLSLFIF